VNINQIMTRYHKTGILGDPRSMKKPLFADVSNAIPYREALDIVLSAEEQFNQIPASIREKFRNNPQEMINFLQNPSNDEEAIKLGLKQPRKPVEGLKIQEASKTTENASLPPAQ
jgi:phage internal scaffolding protein